eukprot:1194449-Prorocentrum_minimum.AAC.2
MESLRWRRGARRRAEWPQARTRREATVSRAVALGQQHVPQPLFQRQGSMDNVACRAVRRGFGRRTRRAPLRVASLRVLA